MFLIPREEKPKFCTQDALSGLFTTADSGLTATGMRVKVFNSVYVLRFTSLYIIIRRHLSSADDFSYSYPFLHSVVGRLSHSCTLHVPFDGVTAI